MKTEKFNPQTQPTENPWGTSDLNIDVDKILAKENDDSALRESELLRLAVEMRAIADGKIPQNNEQSGFELAMREADEIIEKSRQRDIKNKENREFIADDIIKSINKERLTKNFYLEDTCIGCGLCAKKCPVQAIEMKDKKPMWVKEQCALCLGCLHRCPKFAIQYGNGKTKQHGQYKNPHTSD